MYMQLQLATSGVFCFNMSKYTWRLETCHFQAGGRSKEGTGDESGRTCQQFGKIMETSDIELIPNPQRMHTLSWKIQSCAELPGPSSSAKRRGRRKGAFPSKAEWPCGGCGLAIFKCLSLSASQPLSLSASQHLQVQVPATSSKPSCMLAGAIRMARGAYFLVSLLGRGRNDDTWRSTGLKGTVET